MNSRRRLLCVSLAASVPGEAVSAQRRRSLGDPLRLAATRAAGA